MLYSYTGYGNAGEQPERCTGFAGERHGGVAFLFAQDTALLETKALNSGVWGRAPANGRCLPEQ